MMADGMKDQLMERYRKVCSQIAIYSDQMRALEEACKKEGFSIADDPCWNKYRGKRVQACDEHAWLHHLLVLHSYATWDELNTIRETIREGVLE